jgi:carbonic anhydrase
MRVVRLLTASLALLFLVSAGPVATQPVAATSNGQLPDLWESVLKPGNRAFQGDAITFSGLKKTRGDLIRDGQHPPITILACSDSRVPPELVFRQTLGQLFVVRTAGNVADVFGIASIEYGIKKDYTKLLVVLAHEKCGAVEAAINPDPPGEDQTPSLNALVAKIRESFTGPACGINERGCWQRRAEGNAFNAVKDLKKRSKVIEKAIDVNNLPVVVAYYNLDGTVVALSPVATSGKHKAAAAAP